MILDLGPSPVRAWSCRLENVGPKYSGPGACWVKEGGVSHAPSVRHEREAGSALTGSPVLQMQGS